MLSVCARTFCRCIERYLEEGIEGLADNAVYAG